MFRRIVLSLIVGVVLSSAVLYSGFYSSRYRNVQKLEDLEARTHLGYEKYNELWVKTLREDSEFRAYIEKWKAQDPELAQAQFEDVNFFSLPVRTKLLRVDRKAYPRSVGWLAVGVLLISLVAGVIAGLRSRKSQAPSPSPRWKRVVKSLGLVGALLVVCGGALVLLAYRSTREWQKRRLSSPPMPVGEVELIAVSPNQIDLTWEDVRDEKGYRIKRWDLGAPEWKVVGELPADSTHYSDAGLRPATRYRYWVEPYNDAGVPEAFLFTLEKEIQTPAPPMKGIVAVSAGGHSSLALDRDGRLWEWGVGRSLPVPVELPGRIRFCSSGDKHGLAVGEDGSVWAWGTNEIRRYRPERTEFGRLGLGSREEKVAIPARIPELSSIVAVATGEDHSLALSGDGSVWAWGSQSEGLGDGESTVSNRPVKVAGLTGVRAIAAASWHSLALDSSGSVWAWGNGRSGQLGQGKEGPRQSPVPVRIPALADVVAISAGGWYDSLALRGDGTVWSWGGHAEKAPAQVEGLPKIVAIDVGNRHALALAADGSVWAWGSNDDGESGQSLEIKTVDRPARMASIERAVALSAGSSVSLIVGADGEVLGCGSGLYLGREFGDKDPTPRRIGERGGK